MPSDGGAQSRRPTISAWTRVANPPRSVDVGPTWVSLRDARRRTYSAAPMPSPFLERLERAPLVADGAMGTLLYQRGVSFSECFDELNLSRPTLIESVHR